MTSVKSAKLQLQSQPTQILQKDGSLIQNNKSDDQSQNDSSDEENQRIVNMLFPKKIMKVPSLKKGDHTEEDNDIKGFLEEQVPGLYRENTDDDIYDNSSEQGSPDNLPLNDTDYYMNYNINTGPGYLHMSKFQKLSYFDSLNAIYMARMRTSDSKKNLKQHFNKQDPSGGQQTEKKKKDNKKKPAIRFNQIVCEVPFNKNQQPIAVKETPEEQAFIVFDDEAYEDDFEDEEEEEERMVRDMLQRKKMRHMQKTQAYIHEQDDSNSPQTLYNMERMHFLKELNEIQKYNGQGLDDQDEDEDEDHVFFTDSEDELLDFGEDEDQDGWSSDSQEQRFKENQSKRSNKIKKQQLNLSGKQRKNWKRNHQRQFLQDDDQNSQGSSSSSQSSQSSSESSQQNEAHNQQTLQNVKPHSEEQVNRTQLENKNKKIIHQKSQFQEGINGRKINPNRLEQQLNPSHNQTLSINSHEQGNDFDANQTFETPKPIDTENNPVPFTPNKTQEQICQNTSEGQTVE